MKVKILSEYGNINKLKYRHILISQAQGTNFTPRKNTGKIYKKCFVLQDTINKTNEKKFIASKPSNELISRLYKTLQQISKKRQKKKKKEKWTKIKDINKQFPETHMFHNYVTMCSNSLVIIEIQSKTTMILLPPINLTKLRQLDNQNT